MHGKTVRFFLAFALAVALFATAAPSSNAQPSAEELGQIADRGFVDPALAKATNAARWVPTGGGWVEKMEYSDTHDMLLLQFKFGKFVRLVDTETKTVIDERSPTTRFSDLAVTPDGHFLFALDEGREERFDEDAVPSYVHRYDIRQQRWDVLETPPRPWHSDHPPSRIEAVSASRLLLRATQQHTDMTLNTFSVWKNRMEELDQADLLHNGDFVHNPNTGLIYQAGHEEVIVLKVNGPTLEKQYETGREGVTAGRFGSTVLSSDGEHFLWGNIELDARDVNMRKRRFRSRILAATPHWAVAMNGDLEHLDDDRILDAPFWPSAVTVGWGTNDIWLAHPEDASVLHCQTTVDNVGCPVVTPDPLTACDSPTIDMNTNGGDGTGTAGDDVILGTPGDDLILGGAGNDILCGAGGNDVLHGGGGEDAVLGGDGNDTMTGGPGDDSLQGGPGDDIMHGYRGDDYLRGDGGNDRLFGYAGDDILVGDDGDDRLHGNFGNDILAGGPGDDSLFGYGDHDTLYGGDDNDRMSGNFGDDIIIGESGNDVMFGGDGNDGLAGLDGDDIIEGNSLDDIILGGFGDDAIDGGIGADYCDGEDGTDTAVRCERTLGIP